MADKDKLRFLTGQEANLKEKALTRGQVYFAISSDTDSGKIYFDAPIDDNTTKRILMSSDHAKTADKATSADRAIADSNGRKFTETYVSEIKLDNAGTTILYKYPDITTWKELKPKFLPLTGGTITGELYADSITAGDLLVNGSARFVNTILGNIETANQWKTARGFQIADSDAAHTSVSVNVNGSGNVVLKLPSTIKAALQGNADTATKATNDSNNKKITDEYLHRVSNTSSTLNQFSGAPKYLLGIESFSDGGEVKWQSVDSVKVGSASGADKWNTARNFQVSDSDAAHTGTAVSVNGSKAIVLPLPATIKATLEGNASSANKVNHKYTLTLGKTKQTAFDGSADVSITITPESIGALSKDEASAGAAKWSTARMFYVADADASNTGTGVSVDGTKDITLKLPSTIKASITGHASEDLPLAGGTMTGNISYKGSKSTNSMIRFLNNTTDTSGNGISIGGGGVTVIGAGESSQNLTPAANEESLYLMSDGSIKFYTYCDTIGNKRGVILDTSRNFYPDVNNSGSIGTSSNKWNSMYATTFYGALSGTASNATSDIRGNAIINTYLTNVYAKSDDSSYLYKQVGPASERSAELIGRYTPLDSDGLINMKYIPAAALERVVVVANQTAQYALTTANVQLGDVVKRNDTGQLYFVIDTNNLGNANGYLQFTAGTAANVNWSGILNRPNVVGSATGNAIVPNAANTEFTVYQVNGNGTSTSYVIKPNFLPKTGGTITGELYVDGGTTLASLLVNGDARFVNTIQGSISGNAGTADKWATAKAFYIADAEAKHTSSPQVNIDGSQSSYTLKLPSTIKATLEGNADSATKLTNLTEADKASSTNTWRRVWFAYDDNVNGRPSYSDTFAYQSSTGTVKATKFQGALIGNATSADKWKTARSFITNLGSESAASVDGSTGPYNLGVTGTLPVSHGGTGQTDLSKVSVGNADKLDNLHASSFKTRIVKEKTLGEAGWYRILNATTYSNTFLITFYGAYNYQPPTPVTFLVSHSYSTTKITQVGGCAYIGWITKIRAVHYDTFKFYIDIYFARTQGTNYVNFEVMPLDPNSRSHLTVVDFTLITDNITADAECITRVESYSDLAGKWETARTFITALNSESSASVDGSANVTMGVYGTLPVSHGGTGQTSIANIQAGKDADGNTITSKYVSIYNSNNIGSSADVTVNDLAKQGSAVGMIYAAIDNPFSKAGWVHVWSQAWNKTVNTSWVSQIALGVDESDGMWYRTKEGTIVGASWTRVIDSNNYNNYAVKKASSSTDNALVRWDGTTGQAIQNSTATLSDEGHLSVSGKINSKGDITIGSMNGDTVVGAGNFKIGVKNDSYGVMPYANNWNSIGSSGLYWYRAYVTHYYGNTAHITNYDSNGNIGIAATTSAAATLGYINFYNNAAAGATQTKTKLTANSGATTNLTITLPKTDGMLLNEGNYNDFAVKKASSSTDNAIVRWDGTDGRRIQNSLLSISDEGLLTLQTGNHIGAKLGSAYLTSANSSNGEILLQNGHLRFGSDSWDYNQWAGLKYVHSSKIIYLGLADGTIFNANSAQSGGTLALPGIRYFSINGKIAIDANDGWLRINEGKSFATGVYFGSNVVRTDGQLQVGDSGNKFYANSSGNGYFSNTLGIGGTNTSYKLYVNGTSYINGNTTVNGWLKVQNTTDSKNSQDSNASLAIQGGVSVAKQLSAKTVRIDGSGSDTTGSTTQGCTVHFNKTNNCIEFVFD